MEGTFNVLITDGVLTNACDPETSMLRYEDVSWSDATELMRLAFQQGFQVAVWNV